MIWFPIPLKINVANGLLFALELAFAHICYPRLLEHGDYLSTRWRMTNRKYFIPGRGKLRILTGGADVTWLTSIFIFITIFIGLSLVFSLEPIKLKVTITAEGQTITRKTNFSQPSSEEIKCGSEVCKTLEADSSNTYNPFIIYPDYLDRKENTDGDKRCGSVVISCIGDQLGNTLREKSDNVAKERVHVVCCKFCEGRTDLAFSEEFTYKPKNVKEERKVRICSPDNSTLMKAAFEQLRNHADKESDPFNLMNHDVLPGLMFDFNPESSFQKRTFVSGERDGTAVQLFASVIIILIVLVFIHLLVKLFNYYIVGKTYIHHGSSDGNVRAIIETVLHITEHSNRKDHGGLKSRVYFECDLYNGYSVIIIKKKDYSEIAMQIERYPRLKGISRPCPICKKQRTNFQSEDSCSSSTSDCSTIDSEDFVSINLF